MKKIRKWEKSGGVGEFPKFNDSVDLWEEVRYWRGLWDGAFQLEWHKGHQEKRDPTRLSWCINDWMNRVADRERCGVWEVWRRRQPGVPKTSTQMTADV